MKIICEDGSLAGGAILALLAIGLILFLGTLAWAENFYLRLSGFCVGLTMIASGGYAGRAKALGLRSFGRYPWRSARSSYRNESISYPDDRKGDEI